MRKYVSALLLTLLVFLCVPATAAEVAGVKLDDKIALGGQDLVLNGAGIRTKVIFKVYVAGLYVAQPQQTAAGVLAQKGPRRVQMVMLRDLTAEQLLDAVDAGLKDNNAATELEAIKPQVEQLRTIFTALKEAKKGDVVALDYLPESGTKVVMNGTAQGTIPGEPFNRALLKVWLGDKPVDGDLKRALLGAKE